MSRLRGLLHLIILAVLGVLPWMAWRQHLATPTPLRPDARTVRPLASPRRPPPGGALAPASTAPPEIESPVLPTAPALPAACSASLTTGGEASSNCPSGPQ